MGSRRSIRSRTLPSSPSHSSPSSSSSDFEFSVPVSPRKSCPADELFYKGQLLPLHLPPRVSMVRALLLSSSSAGAGPRHSTGSSSSGDSFSTDLSHLAAGIDASCDSARPSSVTDDISDLVARKKSAPAGNKYFSLSRFSNAFKKDSKSEPDRCGSRKLEVIRKYLRKVKPFYEKLSQTAKTTSSVSLDKEIKAPPKDNNGNYINHVNKPRRISVASCPSSIGSSPTHSGSGKLSKFRYKGRVGGSGTTSFVAHNSENSTMVELQSAIQGAIAHCKNSMR